GDCHKTRPHGSSSSSLSLSGRDSDDQTYEYSGIGDRASADPDTTNIEDDHITTAHIGYRESTFRSLEPLAKLSMSSTRSGESAASTAFTVYTDHEPSLGKPLRTLFLNPNLILKYRDAAKRTADPEVQFKFAKALLDAVAQIAGEDAGIHQLLGPRNGISTDCNGYYQMLNEGIYFMTRLAKKQRHPDACYVVGSWYEGSHYWFPRDLGKAHKLYTAAAKGGNDDAMFALCRLERRRGNLDKARYWCIKAYHYRNPHAQCMIGMAYLNGSNNDDNDDGMLGFPVNRKAGYLALVRAADHPTRPLAEASYQLSRALAAAQNPPLIEGMSREALKAMSRKYLMQAAQQGHLLAIAQLAAM
ncbi:hypothetical protein EV182_003745, partial [Spiromyces aspiralis]